MYIRVGSGQTFCRQSRVGLGEIFAGSGPRKVTRGQLWYGRVQGKRPFGRPKKRWLDNVRKDCHLLDMNMENADRLARNRVQWRSAVHWLLERILDSSKSQKH